MSNTWTYTGTYTGTNKRRNPSSSEYQEMQRKDNAERVVRYYIKKYRSIYSKALANEYVSLLFRQRGVPSVDKFTYDIMSTYRSSLGLPEDVPDVLRRIITLGTWSSSNTKITMWTIEPVIASLCVDGNGVDLAAAKEEYSKDIEILAPLTTSPPMTTASNDQMRGRFAGWLTWKASRNNKNATPSCVSCNMCGPSAMFAIHRRGSTLIQMKMTPESILLMSNYCADLSAVRGVTPHLLTSPSTRIKIQPGMSRPRSTSLTMYGNGSMQFAGSPVEVGVLYPSSFELVKMVMNTEMMSFLKTLKRMDVDEIL